MLCGRCSEINGEREVCVVTKNSCCSLQMFSRRDILVTVRVFSVEQELAMNLY